MPEGKSLADAEIWFQDEARVGQQGTITRMWAPKGSRPRALKQLQYEYSYIFGAVCPKKDVSVGLVISEVGIEAMKEHLKLISEKVSPGKIAVIILDRASWHTSKKINVFPNIAILPLPPVSPELNPVEQLWQRLRDRYLANRVFNNCEEIIEACCDAWNGFTQIPNSISSLCSREWAALEN